MLRVEEPRKPQKAVGKGRQGPSEGSPCGLESSSRSPGAGQRDVGPGWAVPLSLRPLGGGLQESRRGSPYLFHTSPVLKLGRTRHLGWALVSCRGYLG